jgi:hypothetical protein
MNKNYLAALIGMVSAVAAAASLTGTASAAVHPDQTAACDALPTERCVGILDAPQALALSVDVRHPLPGARLISAMPAQSRRQDFIIKAPFGDSTVTMIRWAPRGQASGLCVTSDATSGSLAEFTFCNGGTLQQFYEVPGNFHSFVLVNKSTGLSLRIDAITGEVFNRNPGQGTGLNEQFSFHTAA